MSGITVNEKFNCGNDCDYGSGCIGHSAQLDFRGSSETYTFTVGCKEIFCLSRNEMQVLLNLAAIVADERCDAATMPEAK